MVSEVFGLNLGILDCLGRVLILFNKCIVCLVQAAFSPHATQVSEGTRPTLEILEDVLEEEVESLGDDADFQGGEDEIRAR